jgi:KDO2-lipid IV(A) lauroyltransferase
MISMAQPFRKKLKYFFLYYFIKFVLAATRFFPRRWVLSFYAGLSGIAFHILNKDANITRANLKLAFGEEMDDTQINDLAKKVWKNVGKSFADIARAFHFRKKEQLDPIFDVEGLEHLQKAYDQGKGIIGVACHMGPYELGATYVALSGFKTNVIATPVHDPRLDEMLVRSRTSRGLVNIPRGKDNIKIIKALKKGELLFILIDQDTKVDSVFVDFFGKKAKTPIGAALLAKRTGAKLLPIAVRRIENDKVRLIIRPEVPVADTGDDDLDLLKTTEALTRVHESIICEDVAQWIWMHERWKSRPPEENSPDQA